MTHAFLSFIVGMTAMALVALCTDVQQVTAQPHAGGPPSADSPAGRLDEPDSATSITGKVVETMNSGGYTYVQVDDGSQKIWAAGPLRTVTVGDKVVLSNGVPMRSFYSKTLERTFDVVYFVSDIQVVGGQAPQEQAAKAHGAASLGMDEHGAAGHGVVGHGASPHGAPAPAPAIDLSNIKKAAGGQTVAELFANKATLVGKDVVVRGQVVKYTPAVMGKNWIHLQDGSGSTGSNDLTVSTSATAAVGNTVLVRGKLSADRDLGFGYHYDIIIEDAAVAVE